MGSHRAPQPPLQMRCALMRLSSPVKLLAAQVLQLPLSPVAAAAEAQ